MRETWFLNSCNGIGFSRDLNAYLYCSELRTDIEKAVKWTKELEKLSKHSKKNRAWIWLSCNEMGLVFDIEGCTSAFAPRFNEAYVENAVKLTRKRYGYKTDFKVNEKFNPSLTLQRLRII